MPKVVDPPHIKRAIKWWTFWGEWKRQRGEGYATPTSMGYLGARLSMPAGTHTDPVCAQVEKLGGGEREWAVNSAFDQLPPNQHRVIWLRYVKMLPDLESVAAYITHERRTAADNALIGVMEKEPKSGRYVRVYHCELTKPFSAKRATRLHRDACEFLAEELDAEDRRAQLDMAQTMQRRHVICPSLYSTPAEIGA